jgi:O-antigen ligase
MPANLRRPLAALEPWLILALAPAFIFPGDWTPWAVLALPVLWLARWVLPGTPGALHLKPGRGGRRAVANLALLVLGLSIFPALRAATPFGLAAARPALLYLLLGMALFWALVQRRPGRVEAGLWAAMLLVMALFLALLLPLARPHLPPELAPLEALAAHLPARLQEQVNPNVLGGALALLVPFALSLALGGNDSPPLRGEGPGERSIRALALGGNDTPPLRGEGLGERSVRALALLALLVGLAALVVTQSRGALLAVLGAAALLAGLDWIATRRWWLPALLALALGLGLLVGPSVARALPPPPPEERLTLAGRLPIWGATLRMLGRAPLSGVGLGNFQAVMARDKPDVLPRAPGAASHAHQLLLQVAADLGLAGLAAFTALYALSLRAAYRAWRHGERLGMGLFGALVAAGLHGLVDAVQWGSKPAFLLWLFMGLALGLEPGECAYHGAAPEAK